MNNNTTMGNGTSWSFDLDYFDRFFLSYAILGSFYIVAGLFLCVWLVSAIMTSPEMRQNMRNRLVCLVTICDVSIAVITGPIHIYDVVAFLKNRRFSRKDCNLTSFAAYFRLILSFVNSFYGVILLLVFIAQIINYDPTSTFTPVAIRLGKMALMVVPPVLGTILLPTIGATFKAGYIGKDECLWMSKENTIVFRIVDYMIPAIISIILLIVASVLYYRRFHRGISSSQAISIKPELMNRGSQVDSILAYIVAFSIDVVCRFLYCINLFIELHKDPSAFVIFSSVAWMLLDARTILVPWAWLFLEDIRDRIKLWRPWYRPAAGIDVAAITYSKYGE